MVLWKLKKCPRCHGDLFLDRDTDGWYEQCLQCGYRRAMRTLTETKPVPDEESPTPAEARTRRRRTTTRHEPSGVTRRTPPPGPERNN